MNTANIVRNFVLTKHVSMIFRTIFAGEPSNFCRTISMQPMSIINLEVHQCALFFIAIGEYPSLALLYGKNNKGKILSQDAVCSFFTKDIDNTLNVYRDDTGWHMFNRRNDILTITYRTFSIKSPW